VNRDIFTPVRLEAVCFLLSPGRGHGGEGRVEAISLVDTPPHRLRRWDTPLTSILSRREGGKAEKFSEKRFRPFMALLAALVALLSFACSRSGPKPIRVGSKNFSEQVLLGEIVAQALEARGVSVSRKLDLGGTFVCHAALVSDELDLYPEYTGTAYTAILHEKPDSDPAAVRLRVAGAYRKRWNLVWAPPLGFENTFALVVRREDAQRLGLRTISDLAARGQSLRPGFGYEFVERADGYAGLVRAYGLTFRERPVEMDLGLLYPALEAHRVDVVAGNSTDGLIAAIGGTVLEDDRRYFPPYEAAFVVRGNVWASRPEVRATLEALAGRLDPAHMRSWNAEIDKDKKRPEDVAREVLRSIAPSTSPGPAKAKAKAVGWNGAARTGPDLLLSSR
jgi:osmoprotectant transport system substrate-binding protein